MLVVDLSKKKDISMTWMRNDTNRMNSDVCVGVAASVGVVVSVMWNDDEYEKKYPQMYCKK